MKVKVKESNTAKDYYGNHIINFAGYSGERQKDGLVIFDEESKRKLPKGWIKQAEREGYDPFSYVFYDSDLEVVGE